MSLYDTVICDYPLPLPHLDKEDLEDIKTDKDWKGWQSVEWQTKDMGSMLDVYTIEDDGQIYLRGTQWVQDEDGGVEAEEGDLEKYERTAEINFYQLFMGKEYDHWVEFKAIVWKGELKELELVEYKKEDNSERVEMQKKVMEQIKKGESHGKLYKAYKYLVSTPLHMIRVIMGHIISATIKAERWLT